MNKLTCLLITGLLLTFSLASGQMAIGGKEAHRVASTGETKSSNSSKITYFWPW